jgi:hypothetical protein
MNFEYGPEHADPEALNTFWESVRGDFDPNDATTMGAELERRGWFPPDPDRLSDQELAIALERLILDLSWMQVYLHGCDHLDDRELYEELLDEVMNNPINIWPDDPPSAISISFVCERGTEGRDLFYRFYATDEERAWRAEHHPGYRMPPSELPRYPRPWIPIRPLFD